MGNRTAPITPNLRVIRNEDSVRLLSSDDSGGNGFRCPDVPEVFLQRDPIRTLTSEIGQKAADDAVAQAEADGVVGSDDSAPASLANSPPAGDAQEDSPYSPAKILSRDVVGTRRNSMPTH